MLDAQEVVYRKLIVCMEDQQCYLDATLTLAKLSRMAGTNTTYLSKAINQRYGCGFREMVNNYRVQRAKKIIEETGESSYIVGIRCGFPSRSSFYSIFQKSTGTSPRRYLASLKEKEVKKM